MSTLAANDLVESVREDPDLTPAEKEVSVLFTKESERAVVYAEVAGVTRRLLAHPLFEVDSLRVAGDGHHGACVAPDEFGGGEVTGVRGTVPIGTLKVRAASRKSSQWADVVADPASHTGGDR